MRKLPSSCRIRLLEDVSCVQDLCTGRGTDGDHLRGEVREEIPQHDGLLRIAIGEVHHRMYRVRPLRSVGEATAIGSQWRQGDNGIIEPAEEPTFPVFAIERGPSFRHLAAVGENHAI